MGEFNSLIEQLRTFHIEEVSALQHEVFRLRRATALEDQQHPAEDHVAGTVRFKLPLPVPQPVCGGSLGVDPPRCFTEDLCQSVPISTQSVSTQTHMVCTEDGAYMSPILSDTSHAPDEGTSPNLIAQSLSIGKKATFAGKYSINSWLKMGFHERLRSHALGSYADGRARPSRLRRRLRRFVLGPKFETCFAGIIVVNAVIMGLEVQYDGFDVAHKLSLTGSRPASEVWPHAKGVFKALEYAFGFVYIAELCLKFLAFHIKFFKDPWNYIDVIVVSCFIFEMLAPTQFFSINIQFVRLFRLSRLGRFLRLLRAFEGIDALVIMTSAIQGSVGILAWALVLLLMMQLAMAIFMTQVLHVTYFDGVSVSENSCDSVPSEVYEYFGTFTRALVSTFEMTLANWPPICRLLMENVGEPWALVCLVHKLTVGFAVVGVINAVFMQETFKAAATDDDIMMRNKKRARDTHQKKMVDLFRVLDASGDGTITLKEMESALRSFPDLEMWLASMDIQVDKDLQTLFRLIDSKNRGYVTLQELTEGIGRLKGFARSIDLINLMELHFGMRRVPSCDTNDNAPLDPNLSKCLS